MYKQSRGAFYTKVIDSNIIEISINIIFFLFKIKLSVLIKNKFSDDFI